MASIRLKIKKSWYAWYASTGQGVQKLGHWDVGPVASIKVKIEIFVVCQEGAQVAEIGTLGPVASIRLKIENWVNGENYPFF